MPPTTSPTVAVTPATAPARRRLGAARRRSACPSHAPYSDEGLDRAALVHRGVGVGDAFQVGLVVKDATWVDPLGEDVVEEIGEIDAHGRSAAAHADGPGEHLPDWQLDAVRDAHEPDHRTG